MKRVFAIRGKKGKAEQIKKILGLFGVELFESIDAIGNISMENEDFCFYANPKKNSRGVSRLSICHISEANGYMLDVYDVDDFMRVYGHIVNRIPYEIRGNGIEGTIWKGTIVGLSYVDGVVKPLADIKRMEYCNFLTGMKCDPIDFSDKKKRKYLVGTLVGGLMEDPDLRFDAPYDIIEADSELEATRIYNRKHQCSYFYGSVICEIVDGKPHGISRYISLDKVESVLKTLLSR